MEEGGGSDGGGGGGGGACMEGGGDVIARCMGGADAVGGGGGGGGGGGVDGTGLVLSLLDGGGGGGVGGASVAALIDIVFEAGTGSGGGGGAGGGIVLLTLRATGGGGGALPNPIPLGFGLGGGGFFSPVSGLDTTGAESEGCSAGRRPLIFGTTGAAPSGSGGASVPGNLGMTGALPPGGRGIDGLFASGSEYEPCSPSESAPVWTPPLVFFSLGIPPANRPPSCGAELMLVLGLVVSLLLRFLWFRAGAAKFMFGIGGAPPTGGPPTFGPEDPSSCGADRSLVTVAFNLAPFVISESKAPCTKSTIALQGYLLSHVFVAGIASGINIPYPSLQMLVVVQAGYHQEAAGAVEAVLPCPEEAAEEAVVVDQA